MFRKRIILLLCFLVVANPIHGVCGEESNDSYEINTGFLDAVLISTETKHLYNHYPELTYLILKDDHKAYKAGFKILIHMHRNGCCSSDYFADKMTSILAQHLAWSKKRFWKQIRNLSPDEMVRVLEIYESYYSGYRTPDYEEEKNKLSDEFGFSIEANKEKAGTPPLNEQR